MTSALQAGANVLFQDFTSDGYIVIDVLDSLDILIPLGTLSGDDDDISRVCRENCLTDCVTAARGHFSNVMEIRTNTPNSVEELLANR